MKLYLKHKFAHPFWQKKKAKLKNIIKKIYKTLNIIIDSQMNYLYKQETINYF